MMLPLCIGGSNCPESFQVHVGVPEEETNAMVIVYLVVGIVAGTGASIYAYAVLDASFWMALAIYAGVGNISIVATALCSLLLHRREQSGRAGQDFLSTGNGEGATLWDDPVDSLRTTDSRAA